MVSGMIGGLATLLWAVLILIVFIYVTALMFKELFGDEDHMNEQGVNVRDYFKSLPRSMLTIFRCYFGDCSSFGGISLVESMQRAYGWRATILLCALFFFVTVGLFNVISAIFVESTLAAATAIQLQHKRERLSDDLRWSQGLSTLITKLMGIVGNMESTGNIEDDLPLIQTMLVYENHFEEWIKDPVTVNALRDLDILDEDHPYLFDIIDCDNSGAFEVMELIECLQRLRGEPRRS